MKRIIVVTLLYVSIAALAALAAQGDITRYVSEATLSGALAGKQDKSAHQAYSTLQAAHLASKASTAELTAVNSRFTPFTSMGVPVGPVDPSSTASFPTGKAVFDSQTSLRRGSTGGSFSALTGSPYDNAATATALNAKASTSYVDAAIAGVTAGSLPSVSSDPSAPAAGYTWFNTTDHTLNVAQASGRTKFAGTYTAWDTTPDAFSFLDETGIAVLTTKTSAPVTIAGIDYPAAISVTGDTGYGYSKNAAACTATSGTVVAGDTVAACVTSSASGNTATTATVTVGGVSDTYSVTTAAAGVWATDDFNRADSANLGANWGTPTWAGAATPTIVSNAAALGSNDTYGYWTGSTIGNDQCSQVTISGSSNLQNIRGYVRLNPTSYSGYHFRADTGAIYRHDARYTDTLLVTGTTSTLAAGDTIRICAVGSTITAYVNGVQKATVTDSTFATGYPGITIGASTAYADAWAGGDSTVAP